MLDPARYRRRCIMATLLRCRAPCHLGRILSSHNAIHNPPPTLTRRVGMRLPACLAHRGRCHRPSTMRPRRTVAKRRPVAHPTDSFSFSRAIRADGYRSQPRPRRQCSMPSGCTVVLHHQHRRRQNSVSDLSPRPPSTRLVVLDRESLRLSWRRARCGS